MISLAKSRAAFSPLALLRLLIAAAAVLITVLAQWMASASMAFPADEWLRDNFIRLRASSQPETRFVVIDIDESSLARAGAWPWPRARIADLVEQLIGPYGVKAVALDLVLPEAADAGGDARLAMLAQHGPLVLAQAFDYVPRAQALRVGQLGGQQQAAQPAAAPGKVPDRATGAAVPATGFIANHGGLAAARHFGNIGFIPDADGIIRRLPLLTAFGDRQYPTLALALLQCCGEGTAGAAPPDARRGLWRLPYGRDWDAYTVIPAAAILDQSAPADLLQGRLALIGSSSLGLSDSVATPLSANTSGMMVHASALSTLLDIGEHGAAGAWPGKAIAIGFAALVALLAAYSFPRLPAAANVGLLALASLAWLALAYAIAPHDPAFSLSGPIASHLFLLAVAVPFDWQVAQRRSRSLLGTLRQYVAGAVVDELLRSDLKDPLTPRQLNVTTLIADMEGYTSFVESLPMEEAAQLTRDFLACLTRPVLARHGTIDKYTGDGLVAFWGAPLPVEDHADLALDAAQAIVEEVRRFGAQHRVPGNRRLRVRIGIESGMAMAGDFGTPSRSIYTAVGDSVNVAARLEQVARDHPHDIIVGAGTVSRSRRHQFKCLGEITLRGKEKSTTLFTLDLPQPSAAALELSA